MKCILLSFLWLMVSLYFANAKWCIQTTTFDTRVTKILTKIVTSWGFFGSIRRRTVTYVGSELIPRISKQRVCCEGYIFDSVYRICEPHCPLGCPQFSECIKPNSCKCQSGYQMNGESRCEPICEPTCAANAFCAKPNLCLCKSDFYYNHLTKSCELPGQPTTVPTMTSEIESTLWSQQTLSGNHGTNAHCSYAYNCTFNGHCRLEPYNCECNDGFVKADTSCQLRSGIKLGDCIEESLCKKLTTEEHENRNTEEIVSSESSETSTLFGVALPEPTSMKPGQNAYCFYAYNCTTSGHCRLEPYNCECKDGFVKADSSCDLRPGVKHGDCIEESLCEGLKAGEYFTSTTMILSSESSEESLNNDPTTEEYIKSSEQILSSQSLDTTTLTSTENSSNCESNCFNGICVNGLCQCSKGSIFSQKSNGCVINTSCDTICHNGVCQENGLCECPQGFVYEYVKGCVPHCNQKCIKGICVAPETCKCLDGFKHKSKSSFECIPAGKLSEKLERYSYYSNFAWLWVVSAILIIVLFGFFVFKKARKYSYNVDKVEKGRHIVKFDSKSELMA